MKRCGLWIAALLIAGAGVAAAQDVDSSYQNLQDVVAKKDVATIKKLAAETSALARQEIAKPSDADPEAAKKRVEDLRAIDTYTEYALYATAAQSEPAVMVDLIATLEKQNPKSKYLDLGYGPYLGRSPRPAPPRAARSHGDLCHAPHRLVERPSEAAGRRERS
jgi:hypothetical protein